MYFYLIESNSIRFEAKIYLGVCSHYPSSEQFSESEDGSEYWDVLYVTPGETFRYGLSRIWVRNMPEPMQNSPKIW